MLSLGTLLSIREVGERHQALRVMLDSGAVDLDLRGLSGIDTAGLQLLLAAARAAQDLGLKLRLHGAQPVMAGAAAMLGLDALLAASAQFEG